MKWANWYGNRDQRILGMAHDTTAIRRQGVCGRMRYPSRDASEWRIGEDVGGEEGFGSC
jgi:hypothetical protein